MCVNCFWDTSITGSLSHIELAGINCSTGGEALWDEPVIPVELQAKCAGVDCLLTYVADGTGGDASGNPAAGGDETASGDTSGNPSAGWDKPVGGDANGNPSAGGDENVGGDASGNP